MACVPKNLSSDQVLSKAQHNKFYGKLSFKSTNQEKREAFLQLRNSFKVVDIQAENLPKDVRSYIYLQEHESVPRYASLDGAFVLGRRIGDRNTRAFGHRVGVEKAREIGTLKDVTIKAEGGTNIHNSAQGIMENLIHNDRETIIKKNDESEYNYKLRTEDELKRESGLSDQHYKNLKDGVKQVYEDIKNIQRSIDSSGQVMIFTEQFIADFLGDIGGTVDIFVMFSDGTMGILDYKTKSPSRNKHYGQVIWDSQKQTYQLADENWISRFDYDSYHRQLGGLKDIISKRLFGDEFRLSRIIPIHTQYEFKDVDLRKKGEVLNNKLVGLTIGNKQDSLLDYIPIEEHLSNKELDMRLEKLQRDLHNQEVRLQEARGNQQRQSELRKDISRLRAAINNLILRQDLKGVKQEAQRLIKNHSTEAGHLVNVNAKVINGQENPNYMELSDINNLISRLRGFESVLNVTDSFIGEMNIEGKPAAKHIDEINKIAGVISSLRADLESIRIERVIDHSDMEAIANMPEVGFMSSIFQGGQEMVPKIMRILHQQYINPANQRTRLDVQKLEQDILRLKKGLDTWGSRNNTSTMNVYLNKILNKSQNSLVSKYSKDLSKNIVEMRQKRDIRGLKKIFKQKNNAEEIYNERLKKYRISEPNEVELKRWKNANNLKDGAIMHRYNLWIYYEIDPNISMDSTYITDEFKDLNRKGNEELLDFWNFWTSKMQEFRDLLELPPHQKLPYNFLPWIRANVTELAMRGGLGVNQIKSHIQAVHTVQADETMFGMQDSTKELNIETGEEIRGVPIYYINPLKNHKGKIDPSLKTRDLPASLLEFGRMAYTYHYINSDVQPAIEAMRDAIMLYGQQHKTADGRQIRDKGGRVKKLTGNVTDLMKIFDREVRYHVFQERILTKNQKATKRLLEAKQFHSDYQLGGSWLLWLGNAAQIFYNMFGEAYGGYHFGIDTVKESITEATGLKGKEAQEKWKALVYFFEPHSEMHRLKEEKLRATRTQRWFVKGALYKGFRISEHAVEKHTLISMLKKLGIDSDGNIVRLETAPKGTKSLHETSRIEDGELIIEGVKEKGEEVNIDRYSDIRSRVMGVAKNIKGGMNTENQYAAQMYTEGKMIMHYKNWLPGMVKNRAGKWGYNPMTKSHFSGFYRTLLSDIGPMDNGLIHLVAKQIIPSLAQLSLSIASIPLEVVTFGKVKGYRYKLNENRMRRMFENYQREHKGDAEIQAMNYDDYIEYHKGRVRTLSAELFTVLSFYLAVMAMRQDWDDDGVPDWKASWASRTTFRILNRARREISFFITTDDWTYTLTRSPVPAIGVIEDAQRVLMNTIRTTGDYVLDREEAEKRGKGYLQYGPRMFPAYKAVRSIDVLDKEFEKYEF